MKNVKMLNENYTKSKSISVSHIFSKISHFEDRDRYLKTLDSDSQPGLQELL